MRRTDIWGVPSMVLCDIIVFPPHAFDDNVVAMGKQLAFLCCFYLFHFHFHFRIFMLLLSLSFSHHILSRFQLKIKS